jgi:hypothetical protein
VVNGQHTHAQATVEAKHSQQRRPLRLS